MVGGSAYWETDRKKRNQYNELITDAQKKEKRDAWLKELEARDEEEQELKRVKERLIQGRVAEKQNLSERENRAVENQVKKDIGQSKGGLGEVRSVLEASETREGPVISAVRQLWARRR